MGEQAQGTEPEIQISQIPVEDVREYRIAKEREWYTSEEGFIDFVRDCGAAPDAQQKPHGEGAVDILNWKKVKDPEAPDRDLFQYKMVLWPRSSFKSQVFDVGYACWLIACDPNIRILVSSETSKQAKEFVGNIMRIVDGQWFRDRFGVHKGKRWRADGFTSELRTNTHTKEPTLQATGVGEVRTGMHWDFVIMDDVCSQENTKTDQSIEGLWSWFGETMAQLDPGCRLLVIGTMHHFSDIYVRIMETADIRKKFEFSIHAWCDPLIDPNDREAETKLFFPGRLTRAYVKEQKALLTSRLFSCFYENQPIGADQQLFKPAYFKVIEDDDIPTNVWTYIFTDWAFIAEGKKKGKTDRTCFWVVSIDCNRYAYVRDFYVGRWKPSDSVTIACDLWNRYSTNRYNMRGLVVEDTTHKELLSTLFDEMRRTTFIRPNMISIGGRTQEVKDYRIEAMEPRFREGLIYFARSLKENHNKWGPMFKEMTRWPLSPHDDIPDALSDIDKRLPTQNGKLGAYYCPAPPPGWRSAGATMHHPNLLDGRYNPERGYPAREFTKANQQGGGQADLWRSSTLEGHEGPMSPAQSIFQKQPQQPSRLGKS